MGDSNSNNNNGAGWLIAAALIGAAGVAGAKSNKKKQVKKEQERLERERQVRLEQERRQREYENSFEGKAEKVYNGVCKFLNYIVDQTEPKVAEAKANAEEMMKRKKREELLRLTRSENSILSEAASAELQRRKTIMISEWIKLSRSNDPVIRSIAKEELEIRGLPT